MEPMWVPGGYEPVIVNGHQARPGQRRGRLASDHVDRHPQMYYQDGNRFLVPAGPAGAGRMRAASASDQRRPAQIVINNEVVDNHSPQRSPHRHQRHRSHDHDYRYDDYSDDSWDDRAHSPHRHRRHNRHRRTPSRSPSPYEHYDYDREKLKAKVEELERRERAKEEEERQRERFEEERLLEEARKLKKKEEEEKFKKRAIEEYNIKQLEEKAKAAEEKRKADEDYKKRVVKDFQKAGYDEEEIKEILKGKEKHHGHEHALVHGGHGHEQIVDLRRPTFLRVHRKHLSPETLDIYDLPWDWDEVSFPLTKPSLRSPKNKKY